MIVPAMKLDEIKVTGLDVFANPSDIRFDLHAFVGYARSHEIKRGHRDNRIPLGHQQRLAKLMSHPLGEAEMDDEKFYPWIDHLDDICLQLEFVKYDLKGIYAGYSSSEPSFPDNYMSVDETAYGKFVKLPLQAQEERLLEIHLGSGDAKAGGNEFFSKGVLNRLDAFDGFGCATGVVPTIPFPNVRRRLLQLLAECPSGIWFSTESLVQHLRLDDPWFMIPKEIPLAVRKMSYPEGRYGNFVERKRGDWGNRTPISDKDPEGFVKVEGRYLERFLEGIPLVLGYTEVAYLKRKTETPLAPSRGLLPAFRVTERLRRTLHKEIAAPKVTVLPNFEVHLESLFFSAQIERELRPLGDLVQSGIATVFKLTRPKVAAALAADPGADAIATLKLLSGRELPPNVEQELSDWAGHSEKFVLYEGFGLLEGRREEAHAEQFIEEAISPDFAIIRNTELLHQNLERAEQIPLKIRHGDKALKSPEQGRTRLAPAASSRGTPVRKPLKIKRSVRTTLWFAEAEAHTAFCKILLDAKCVVPTDPRALTVSYARKDEPLIKEFLKKLNQEYALSLEDIET
jgi:hypothetical protein